MYDECRQVSNGDQSLGWLYAMSQCHVMFSSNVVCDVCRSTDCWTPPRISETVSHCNGFICLTEWNFLGICWQHPLHHVRLGAWG